MKKLFLCSLTVLLILGLTVGCGKKNENTNAATHKLVSEKVIHLVLYGILNNEKELVYNPCTLTFSWWGEKQRNEATLKAIETFENKYPGIIIEATYGEWDQIEATMKEQLETGQGADISQMSWNWLHTYSQGNPLFYDLYLGTEALDLTQVKQKYLDQCMVKDELLGLPISVTGKLFFFNVTKYREAGIEIPENLDDLIKAGEVFKVRLGEEYYPLALNEYDRMIFMIYYLQALYGKEWVVNNELQYNVEEITKGMEFLRTLEEAHVMPPIQELSDPESNDLSQMAGWTDGRYGGVFAWDTSVIKFRNCLENGQEMVVKEFFTDIGPYEGGFSKISMVLSISNQCLHKREAEIFIDFMLNDEEGIRNLEATRGIPISKAGLEQGIEENLFDQQTVEANRKMLDSVSFSMDPKFESVSNEQDMYSIYQEIMSSLSYGDYNQEEAARILIQEIESAYED